MTWFGYALVAIILFSFSNHIDKYLVSRYLKGAHPGSLILFSSLFGIVACVVIFLIRPNVFLLPGGAIGLLLLAAFFSTAGLICYLYAVRLEEISVVTPLWQMMPVIGYGLGYVFLGEILTGGQILAGLLVLLGAFLISLDLENLARPKLKHGVLLLMFLTCTLMALSGIVFKFVALEQDFLTSAFWNYAGVTLIGLLLFLFIRPYREQFLSVFKLNRAPIIAVNLFNEILGTGGGLLMAFATLLAPITLVWIMGATSPFFTFIWGVLFTLFLPRIVQEKLTSRVLFQKLIAMTIIFIGVYLLNSAS
ncbi:MAG: EamA family transporter [bacterium]|nr:EamA family transporter [bacterium]